MRIGRSELNDLPLREPFVSTYHALVRFDDESATYVDVGSTNGSALDGVVPVQLPLEPHLSVAEASYGRTSPELFHAASQSLYEILTRIGKQA